MQNVNGMEAEPRWPSIFCWSRFSREDGVVELRGCRVSGWGAYTAAPTAALGAVLRPGEARANACTVLPPAAVGLGYYLASLSKNGNALVDLDDTEYRCPAKLR